MSTTHDLKPISSNLFSVNDQKAALANFNPYKALTTVNNFPSSGTNSFPALIQYFSKLGADIKTF